MSGERTEAATPQAAPDLRGQGKTARSRELASTIGLLVGCIILQNTAASAAGHMQGLLADRSANWPRPEQRKTLTCSGRSRFWSRRPGMACSVLPMLVILPALELVSRSPRAWYST